MKPYTNLFVISNCTVICYFRREDILPVTSCFILLSHSLKLLFAMLSMHMIVLKKPVFHRKKFSKPLLSLDKLLALKGVFRKFVS